MGLLWAIAVVENSATPAAANNKIIRNIITPHLGVETDAATLSVAPSVARPAIRRSILLDGLNSCNRATTCFTGAHPRCRSTTAAMYKTANIEEIIPIRSITCCIQEDGSAREVHSTMPPASKHATTYFHTAPMT